MPRRDVLQQLIADFHAAPLPPFTAREYPFMILPSKVLALTGPRRAGKTYCLFQLMQQLLTSGTPKENLLYINFEDERLYPLAAAELGEIIEAYDALYPQKSGTRIHIFLDEIQNVPGWERFVRRLHDTRKAQLYVTGSSAHLLSRDIATALRGRTLTYTIFPFSFAEYLRHFQIDPRVKTTANLAKIRHAFATYAVRGGYPEVLSCPESAWRAILQDYLNLLIYKDLADRYRIKNTRLIRYLIRTLLQNIAAPFSIHKLYRDLKSQGYRVGKDTLHQYLGYLEDAYSFFAVPIFSESVRVQQVNYRKSYAVDIGLVTASVMGVSEKRGQLLENLVYCHLARRSGAEIFYYKTRQGKEIDFVQLERGKIVHLIQVAEHLADPVVAEREIPALWSAMEELHLRRATIVTRDTQKELRRQGRTIDVVPATTWLLE